MASRYDRAIDQAKRCGYALGGGISNDMPRVRKHVAQPNGVGGTIRDEMGVEGDQAPERLDRKRGARTTVNVIVGPQNGAGQDGQPKSDPKEAFKAGFAAGVQVSGSGGPGAGPTGPGGPPGPIVGPPPGAPPMMPGRLGMKRGGRVKGGKK